MRARAALHQIMPPIVVSALRRRRRPAPKWEYVSEEWINDDGPGWDAEGVVDAYRRKLAVFREAIAAPSPIGVATEAGSGVGLSQYHQNEVLEYAYAVARAARDRDRISILDWGGGFGFMSFVVAELFSLC